MQPPRRKANKQNYSFRWSISAIQAAWDGNENKNTS